MKLNNNYLLFLAKLMERCSSADELLMEKSNVIGKELGRKFKPTVVWLSRWKQRNAIKCKQKHGEGTQSEVTVAKESKNNITKTLL